MLVCTNPDCPENKWRTEDAAALICPYCGEDLIRESKLEGESVTCYRCDCALTLPLAPPVCHRCGAKTRIHHPCSAPTHFWANPGHARVCGFCGQGLSGGDDLWSCYRGNARGTNATPESLYWRDLHADYLYGEWQFTPPTKTLEEVRWSHSIALNAMVFSVTSDGRLFCLDADTGAEQYPSCQIAGHARPSALRLAGVTNNESIFVTVLAIKDHVTCCSFQENGDVERTAFPCSPGKHLLAPPGGGTIVILGGSEGQCRFARTGNGSSLEWQVMESVPEPISNPVWWRDGAWFVGQNGHLQRVFVTDHEAETPLPSAQSTNENSFCWLLCDEVHDQLIVVNGRGHTWSYSREGELTPGVLAQPAGLAVAPTLVGESLVLAGLSDIAIIDSATLRIARREVLDGSTCRAVAGTGPCFLAITEASHIYLVDPTGIQSSLHAYRGADPFEFTGEASLAISDNRLILPRSAGNLVGYAFSPRN